MQSPESEDRHAQLRQNVDKYFLAHPHAGGETYLQHLWFTLKMAAFIIYTGICLLIHGFIPAFHQTTTSTNVARLTQIFAERRKKIEARQAQNP